MTNTLTVAKLEKLIKHAKLDDMLDGDTQIVIQNSYGADRVVTQYYYDSEGDILRIVTKDC